MDNWATPKWLIRMYDDYFDPCPLNPNWTVDGLKLDWKDKTFVNPPYSNVVPWVEKAIKESKKGKRIVMLLNVDTSTNWYAKLNEAGAEFLWFSRRLAFSRKGKNNKPSMLVILSQSLNKLKEEDISRQSQSSPQTDQRSASTEEDSRDQGNQASHSQVRTSTESQTESKSEDSPQQNVVASKDSQTIGMNGELTKKETR